jgi:membrane protein DedA with SNARE-associated domain
VFAKVGAWSLLFAKFFPGLTTISVAMAGVTKMSLPFFLFLNGIGALLFVSVPVLVGWIFQNAITDILNRWGVYPQRSRLKIQPMEVMTRKG